MNLVLRPTTPATFELNKSRLLSTPSTHTTTFCKKTVDTFSFVLSPHQEKQHKQNINCTETGYRDLAEPRLSMSINDG